MKRIILLILSFFLIVLGKAQQKVQDSLADFKYTHFNKQLSDTKDKAAREKYLQTIQWNFIERKNNSITEKAFESLSVSTSTCGNLDFEDGNVNSWTMSGDFQVMSGTGLDPYGGFPLVCPGGNFSLRLNDDNTNTVLCSPPGTKSTYTSTASHSLVITSLNTLVKVNLAACFYGFSHNIPEAPSIKINFYDQANNLITPLTFSAAFASPSTTNTPNPVLSSSPIISYTSTVVGSCICGWCNDNTIYVPWQTKSFNLSSYIGTTVKMELVAGWCFSEADWGYAYFDVCCDGTCPDILAGVNTLESYNNPITFYPNPFGDEISINIKGVDKNEFILFNTLGQEILRKQLTNGKTSIETSTLPPGLYIYSLLSQNKQVKQGKLVKE